MSAPASHPRVLIVCEHASHRMGGEAARPLHYFRVLRSRGVEAWLLVHARTKGELREALPEDDFRRVHFVPDTRLQQVAWSLGDRFLPETARLITVASLNHLITQVMQRRLVKQLVRQLRVDVVHEPIPISPKLPSMTFNVGAPVVIGPLNGGMTYPPAFSHMENALVRATVGVSRLSSALM